MLLSLSSLSISYRKRCNDLIGLVISLSLSLSGISSKYLDESSDIYVYRPTMES